MVLYRILKLRIDLLRVWPLPTTRCGVLLSQRHQDDAARNFFAKRLKEHPKDAMLHYLYAEQLGRDPNATEPSLRDAIASLDQAAELEPSYLPIYGLLCTLQRRVGDEAGALATAKAALVRDPEDETVLYQALLASRKLHHARTWRRMWIA